MVTALTEQRAKGDRRTDIADQAITRVYPISQRRPPNPAEPETRIESIPDEHRAMAEVRLAHEPASPPAPADTQDRATVTALPLWRRHARRPRVAVGVAAAVIIAAAIVIPLRVGGGFPAQTSVAIPLHVTDAGKAIGYGAATGRATARQSASGSWNITLSVAHLKHFDPAPWYGCWYVSRDGRQVTSAGTFLVPKSGSTTLSMTSAVDPHDFPTMQITISEPNSNGALSGTVILSGHAL